MSDVKKPWMPIIMFVDDDAKALATQLNQFSESYVQAIGVTSPDDAIKKMNELNVDLIVTDFSFGSSIDSSGLKLAHTVRELNRELPIVGVSSYIANLEKITGIDPKYFDSIAHTSQRDASFVAILKELASEHKHKVEQMHDSLFISFGGPDQQIASAINSFLQRRRVKTWFFPQDALPGQKLHRVMSEGVNSYDRVLLICSSASLTRSGVLNEIERVLEREAREGGSEILIPITIDDYVFTTWNPSRTDVADQVRSRVISTFPTTDPEEIAFQEAGNKLIAALRR